MHEVNEKIIHIYLFIVFLLEFHPQIEVGLVMNESLNEELHLHHHLKSSTDVNHEYGHPYHQGIIQEKCKRNLHYGL